MKKAFLLICVLLVFVLAACGNSAAPGADGMPGQISDSPSSGVPEQAIFTCYAEYSEFLSMLSRSENEAAAYLERTSLDMNGINSQADMLSFAEALHALRLPVIDGFKITSFSCRMDNGELYFHYAGENANASFQTALYTPDEAKDIAKRKDVKELVLQTTDGARIYSTKNEEDGRCPFVADVNGRAAVLTVHSLEGGDAPIKEEALDIIHNRLSFGMAGDILQMRSFWGHNPDTPFIDLPADNIDYITYNDNSAPPDTPVETYTDMEEMGKIIDMLASLDYAQGAAYEEAAPGNYASYTVHYLNGTEETISRVGRYVFFGDHIFHAQGFARQPHKNSTYIAIDSRIALPQNGRLNMVASAYDEEHTVINSIELKSFDGDRWNVHPLAKEFVPVSINMLPDYLDLNMFSGVSSGDYIAIFSITYPSGDTEELTAVFNIGSGKDYYSYNFLPASIPYSAQYAYTRGKTVYAPSAKVFLFKEELLDYCAANANAYDFQNFLAVCEGYDEEFFYEHKVILVTVSEPSASTCREITEVIIDGDPSEGILRLKRTAQSGSEQHTWHIFIEIERDCAINDPIVVEI